MALGRVPRVTKTYLRTVERLGLRPKTKSALAVGGRARPRESKRATHCRRHRGAPASRRIRAHRRGGWEASAHGVRAAREGAKTLGVVPAEGQRGRPHRPDECAAERMSGPSPCCWKIARPVMRLTDGLKFVPRAASPGRRCRHRAPATSAHTSTRRPARKSVLRAQRPRGRRRRSAGRQRREGYGPLIDAVY